MSRFAIETIFKAGDRFSAPLSKFQNQVNKATRSARNGFKKLNRAVDGSIDKINQMTKSAMRLAAIGIGAVVGSVTVFLREFSKIEDAVAAFTPLLGGAENAQKAVDLLNQTAASTPFQFEQLSSAANTLLGFGAATLDTLIPTIRMLGDTAGGSSDKLGRIALAFSKIEAAGKADMQDLNQLIDAGIPIFGELEKITGKNTVQLRKMSSQGKITSELINKAFKQMTAEGGKFFNGMEIASQTLTGQLSTLKDNISLTAAEIGSVLAPIAKDYVKQATEAARQVRAWVTENKALIAQNVGQTIEFIKENAKFLGQTLVGLIQIYIALVAWSTAVKVVTIATKIAMIGFKVAVLALNATLLIFKGILAVVRLGIIAFNFALAVNPIGAIVLGVGLLITALGLLILNFDKVKLAVTDAFEAIANKVKPVLDLITAPFRNIFSGLSGLSRAFGLFGGDSAEAPGGGGVVTPDQRTAKTIEERSAINKAELTIKDESGKAELSGETQAPGSSISMADSGGF